MLTFGHVTVFVSIVLGMAIARILGGLADLINNPNVKWSRLHVTGSVLLLLFSVWEWWIIGRWHSWTKWNLYIFLFLLVKPSILYFLSALHFPEADQGKVVDLEEHYFQTHRWTYLMLAFVVLMDIPDTLLKGWDYFLAIGIQYPLVHFPAVIIVASGSMTKNKRYHAVLLLFLGLILALTSVMNAAISWGGPPNAG